MHGRKAKTMRCGGFRVELDQHRGLLTHDPRIMPWFHDHHLRRHKVEGTAISIRALDVTAGQETNVRMHAELRAHERFQVRGPAEARWINETLQTTVRRLDTVDSDA